MFPCKGVGGAEYPYVLIGMIEEWGGEVIDYPERRHCCGFGFRQYLIQANRGFSISCSKKKFDSMEPYKPDMILTNCPGCPMFLDRWQYAISEMEGKTYGENGQGIPVLTYEELAGLVLGYDPWDLGLQVHQVPVEPLLEKIGIPYDPEMKFKGARWSDLGKPEQPSFLKFLSGKIMRKTAIIIGGGIAGMETASQLARLGIAVDLIEKQSCLGGHINSWDRLFPRQTQ